MVNMIRLCLISHKIPYMIEKRIQFLIDMMNVESQFRGYGGFHHGLCCFVTLLELVARTEEVVVVVAFAWFCLLACLLACLLVRM